MADDKKTDSQDKPKYYFGGIKEFNLVEIETEVLNDSIYLDVFAGSDSAFKEEIRPLENGLDKIMKLEAFEYLYKTEQFSHKNFPEGNQIGFMAQTVREQFPHLTREDNEGHLSVNYAGFTPILLQGLKELSTKVEEQEATIQKLIKKLEEK
ncbi:MAG: tail fiber domain-containing protein [Halobacteriovoraceae bacterium]|nr:tail fiber domain-containing protein [Halobacteriovoraceae bacterium]